MTIPDETDAVPTLLSLAEATAVGLGTAGVTSLVVGSLNLDHTRDNVRCAGVALA